MFALGGLFYDYQSNISPLRRESREEILTDLDASFIAQVVARHCGPDAAVSFDFFLSTELKRHENILHHITNICPPTSFLPIAGREVWPAAADVIILDSDISGDNPENLVRERMNECTQSIFSNKACFVFLHTVTLKATANEVLSILNSNEAMKIILISSSNQDICVPW